MNDFAPPAAAPAPTPAKAPTALRATRAKPETAPEPATAPFGDALAQQMQGATAPQQAAPALSDLLAATLTTVPTETPAAETAGSALPQDGEALPVDPALLGLPALAAMLSETDASATQAGTNLAESADRLSRPLPNLAPLANAIARVAVQQGQDRPVEPGLIAAAVQQLHEAADVPGQGNAGHVTPELPLAATAPQPVTNVMPAAVAHLMTPTGTTSTATPQSLTPPTIEVPVQQPGWDQALGQRLQWMVNHQVQNAELRVTPPQLGPLEVRISIGQDQQASITFASPHGVVRDAVESALPRLREMLGDSGLNLVDVNVSQQSFAEQRRQATGQGDAQQDSNYGFEADAATEQSGATSGTSAIRSGLGLVDTFA